MIPVDTIHRQIKKLRLKASAHLDRRVHDAISAASAKPQMIESPDTQAKIWRTVMNSKITKLAAAAAIIVAVFLGLHFINPLGATVTLAEAVEPFLTSRTATFKIRLNGEGVPAQEFDGMFMEPGRMRHNQPGGGIVIVDLEKGKFLTLIPQLKQAVVLELTNVPEDPGSLNFFQEIRNRILKAQPLNDESAEFLGRQQVEGQSAIGYHVRKPGLDATVWANAETKMPVQIEVFEDPMTITMSNIAFDVELDEKLFSLDIPEGYSVKTLQRNLSEPTEKDFIESFRIWAEHMDGRFPSKMDRSAVNEFMKYQQEKMKQKGIEPTIEDITQLQQIIIDMTHGFPFVESLPADSDWHYAGKDVKFGDAATSIFWYRPKGSKNYRIIYGDLSVKDVTPENLPKQVP